MEGEERGLQKGAYEGRGEAQREADRCEEALAFTMEQRCMTKGSA